VDTFRIALAEEQNLLIKEKHSQGHQLSILFLSSVTETFFFLILENPLIRFWKIITQFQIKHLWTGIKIRMKS